MLNVIPWPEYLASKLNAQAVADPKPDEAPAAKKATKKARRPAKSED